MSAKKAAAWIRGGRQAGERKEMNLTHLRYFSEIARSGSVSAASRKLHVAQPALSRALMALETEVGHRLFDREGKSLTLNRRGEILLKYAEQIFLSLDDAQKELDDFAHSGANTVTVRMASGAAYFVSRLALFQREHPEVTLRVLDASPEEQSAPPADFTIYASEQEEDGQTATLLRERLALAVPGSHPLAEKERVFAADLADEPLLAAAKGTALRRCFDRYFAEAGLTPVIRCEFFNTSLFKTVVANGLGLALVPETTWADAETGGAAKLIPLGDVSFGRFVHLKLEPDRYVTDACRRVMAFLISGR